MTETSPAPAPVASESFPEFDAPPFVPPAPSSALNADVPAPAAAPAEPTKPAEEPGDAPSPETPAAPAPAGPKPAEEPPATEAGEPEPGPFSFAGRTFKDSAAAEHYLKTMEGRAKAEAKRVVETEQKLTEAARAATYYKAEAEKKARTPETPPVPAKKEPDKSFLETLPWPAIRKLHDDEGFDAALFFALQQTTGHLEKNFEAKLKAALEPVQQREQAEKLRVHVTDLFQAAEDFTDADGKTPVYPELREGPETNAAIARIWATLDPQFAVTERGVDYAILRYRAERAGTQPPKPPAPSGAPAPTAETLAAAAHPAPEPLNGGGVPRQPPGGIEGARSKRVLGEGHRPRLTPSGESLGFID